MSDYRTENVSIRHQPKIIHNRARCKSCGSVIESKHQHDFVRCACGKIFVDGGHEYLRCGGDFSVFEDQSVTEPVDEDRKKALDNKIHESLDNKIHLL